MRHIQITEELFVRICRFHLYGEEEQANAIKQGLNDKLEALTRRDLYSKAIKGDEESRREYLDRVGVPDKFRW